MTQYEYISIVINAILYLSLIYRYWRKTRCFNAGMFLLSIWTASAVFSLWYEPFNFIGHYHTISFPPFIYIFVLNLIAFYPILKFKHQNLTKIKANTSILLKLCIIVGILSILPFIENLIYALSHVSSSGFEQLQDSMNERYEDTNLRWAYLSSPALMCSRLIGFIGINLISLLLVTFPLFFNIKRHKYAFGCILIANLNFFLNSLNTFARFNIAIQLVMLISCLIIVSRLYAKQIRKSIFRYATIAVISIVSIFVTITVYRLSNFNERTSVTNANQGMLIYIGQYLCEGMPNFSADIYRATVYNKIEEIERAVRISLFREQGDLAFRKDVPTNGVVGKLVGPQFSTWIGNFYLSQGPVILTIIFLLMSWFMFKMLPRGQSCSFTQIYLIIAYLRMPILGICYNTYAVASDEFVGELFIIPFLFFCEHNYSRYISVQQNA